jgi:hypothetical protein
MRESFAARSRFKIIFIFKGDVSDLDLTFSLDEEVMGKVVNHELFPGGRLTAVTNENRQEKSSFHYFLTAYFFQEFIESLALIYLQNKLHS